MNCDKCFTPQEDCVRLTKYGDLRRDCLDRSEVKRKDYFLCNFCYIRFTPEPDIEEFLKDDYGEFPISTIAKNMIDARKRRALQFTKGTK